MNNHKLTILYISLSGFHLPCRVVALCIYSGCQGRSLRWRLVWITRVKSGTRLYSFVVALRQLTKTHTFYKRVKGELEMEYDFNLT